MVEKKKIEDTTRKVAPASCRLSKRASRPRVKINNSWAGRPLDSRRDGGATYVIALPTAVR